MKIAKRPCENVEQLKCLGGAVTDQDLILEKIKGNLNSGNAYYHSVQNLFIVFSSAA
jgi:hypothetical protein